MGLQPGPADAALVVLACAAGLEVCYIAATRTRRVSVTGAAMAVGAGLLIPLLGVPSLGSLRVGSGGQDVHLVTVAVPLVTIIAWLIGNSIRQAQARAELVRAQAAAQAAMAERLRIARELHDMVAHSIGIIAIQAGSGRRVFDARPDEARDALAAIEATSRETLSGLRRMVTGLRRADPEPGPGQAPLGPAPGLADIDRLAATTRDAGVQVEVDWRGSREPLPADIDLSAFRIIQEAVTNVVRHAGTGQCQVLIDQQDGQLSIEVTDSGRGGSHGRDRLRDHRHARARRAARRRLLGRPAPRRRLPRRRPAASPRAGPMTIQVILADDQPLIRAGLRRLIDQTPGIDVAGEAGTGAEAVQLARDTSPDVVVMDIRMPGMDGIEATQMITAGDTRARVLVLTTFDDDDYVYGALRAGASGFLVKDMALEDILTAIRVVAAGDAIIAPGVTRRLIAQFASQPRPDRKPRELTGITDREREVLKLVGLGMSNAEIAAALYITAGTAKTHVARLLAKLGARDRVQLVITAYQAGLVDT